MKKLIFCCLFVLLLWVPGISAAQDSATTVIDFSGELVDQDATPVSGVLPLEFRIFSDGKSKKAIAIEKHYVSVVDGRYAVTLGENSEISTKKPTMVVAVYLDNKELIRQEVGTLQQVVPVKPNRTTTQSAGSESGESFRLECPEGYVVTGIEGNQKNGIQGLKLICTRRL